MDVGSSAETAVVVGALWAEYAWLQEHHRDWTVVSHRECVEGERVFDILTLASPNGETREFYFDVSGCLCGPRPTPPCPYCGEPLVSGKARQGGGGCTDFYDSGPVVTRKGRA